MKADRESLQRIWKVVASIPAGEVASYGSVARRAGLGRAARLVGHALKVAPDDLGLPWHRVVNAAGRISFPPGSPGYVEQRRRLEAEGLRFRGATVIPAGREVDELDALLWGPHDRATGRRRRQ
jgi:methylated-DNA-protein-cysteine methyltransferase-like protein